MLQSLRCPECGKRIRIPTEYNKTKGKCPSCKAILDLSTIAQTKSRQTADHKSKSVRKKTNESFIPVHPLILLTEKYASNLKKYGFNLQKVYALLREQIIHKREFEKQKTLLKKETFAPIIDEIIRLPDFSFSLQERIELWYDVFDVLPYTLEDKNPNVVFNVYPRYEYAGLVSMGYVLSGYSDKKLMRKILTKTVKGERTTPHMKEIFSQVITSPYKDECIKRIQKFLKETRQISKDIPRGKERSYRQIEEDFNFGFSWVAFHIPS